MPKIRYYCQANGEREIIDLLEKIKEKHRINFEILNLSVNGQYSTEKEKEAYERDFKPRAKILKMRTEEPITQLRSRRARNYFVSKPGTIVVINENNQVEWYTVDKKEEFLKRVLDTGEIKIWDKNV